MPTEIRQKKLQGFVWGSAINESGNEIILDVRPERGGSCEYVRLDLVSFELKHVPFKNGKWWSTVEAYSGDELLFVHYTDRNDPNRKEWFRLNMDSGEIRRWEGDVPGAVAGIQPFLYKTGTEYHRMVADFLKEELLLPCEYLEINDKIVMCHYLRSDNGFDRFLLTLNDHGLLWNVRLDKGMKGFSSGSFFVYNNRLIFFKDRNEVCCYPV